MSEVEAAPVESAARLRCPAAQNAQCEGGQAGGLSARPLGVAKEGVALTVSQQEVALAQVLCCTCRVATHAWLL